MMRRICCLAAVAVVAFHTAGVHAQVRVQDAWVRATVPQQSATGAFMRLTADKDTQLVAASSPVAPVAEVHQMTMQGDIMRMRAVPALALTAGQPVDLKPGGYHIMLMELTRQIKEGDTVPLTLTFETAAGVRETVQLQVPVRPLNAAGPAAKDESSHDHKRRH